MLRMSFLGLVIFCSVTLSICVYVHVELLHIFFRELTQLLTDRWHILCSMLLFAFNMLESKSNSLLRMCLVFGNGLSWAV